MFSIEATLKLCFSEAASPEPVPLANEILALHAASRVEAATQSRLQSQLAVIEAEIFQQVTLPNLGDSHLESLSDSIGQLSFDSHNLATRYEKRSRPFDPLIYPKLEVRHHTVAWRLNLTYWDSV